MEADSPHLKGHTAMVNVTRHPIMQSSLVAAACHAGGEKTDLVAQKEKQTLTFEASPVS